MDYKSTEQLREFRWNSETTYTPEEMRTLRDQAGLVLDEVSRLESLVTAYRLVVKDSVR